VHLHIFLVYFYTDGRLVDVRIDALYKAANEAGLSDSERAEHADFFLEHDWGSGHRRADAKGGTSIELAILFIVFGAKRIRGAYSPGA